MESPIKELFGVLADGTQVFAYTLQNQRGSEVKIITYGGAVVSIYVPDRAGKFKDVVLGFRTLDEYVQHKAYFGSIVGRYANRIAYGRFEVDGQQCKLAINNEPNSLHGGSKGFDKVVWNVVSATADAAGAVLHLSHTSPDGDEGFPGTLQVEVIYTFTSDSALRIDYKAVTDKPTVINLSNHSYFNLTGEGKGDVLQHQLVICADKFTPVGDTLIPTGEMCEVDDTPFDFRIPRTIGECIRDGSDVQLMYGHGYDHNYVLNEHDLTDVSAVVRDPVSGRCLEVYTTEPGLQLYTSNFLIGEYVGKSGRTYRQSDGLCLETQHFPDSPNQPQFPSTVLRPGETYHSTTIYKFMTDAQQ